MAQPFITKIASVALAALACMAGPTAFGQDAPDPYTFAAEGLGPVTVGMPTADAVKALGAGWSYRGLESDNDQACGHITLDSPWSAMMPMFMAQSGVVTRIEVGGGAIYTDKGIHVGSTEAQVLEAYGAAVHSEPHAYIGSPAKYLTVWFKNAPAAGATEVDAGARGIRFLTDENGIVTQIFVGDPSIQYIEGCA